MYQFFAIAGAIAAVIAAGAVCTYAVRLTLSWLKNKVRQIFNKRNIKKCIVADLGKLVDECPNEMSLDEFLDKGYTHVTASVDYNGKIDKVDIIKDTGNGDYELENTLDEEGMIVITR